MAGPGRGGGTGPGPPGAAVRAGGAEPGKGGGPGPPEERPAVPAASEALPSHHRSAGKWEAASEGEVEEEGEEGEEGRARSSASHTHGRGAARRRGGSAQRPVESVPCGISGSRNARAP